MPRLPPPPHRIACAKLLAELWPLREVAAALEVIPGTLRKWGIEGRPFPQRRLADRLLAAGATPAEAARYLGKSRQAVHGGRSGAPGKPGDGSSPGLRRRAARAPVRACARILAELWPRRKVAAALGVSLGQLAAWGILAEPTPEERLKARLVALGASPREAARMLRAGAAAREAAEGEAQRGPGGGAGGADPGGGGEAAGLTTDRAPSS